MSQVRVPDRRGVVNEFATAEWWSDQAADQVAREDGVTVLTLDDDTSPATLLVVPAITRLLAEPTLEALDHWRSDVRVLQTAAPGALRIAVSVEPVRSLEQLATLARARRWPEADVSAAARRATTDPVPAPSAPGGLRVIHEYVDALLAQVEVLLEPGWITAAEGVADATACLIRSLDADPEIDHHAARSLRAACRAALAELESDGVTISGPRDALLWPVPSEPGGIPIDVAADAALEIMLGAWERPADGAGQRPSRGALEQSSPRDLVARLRGAR